MRTLHPPRPTRARAAAVGQGAAWPPLLWPLPSALRFFLCAQPQKLSRLCCACRQVPGAAPGPPPPQRRRSPHPRPNRAPSPPTHRDGSAHARCLLRKSPGGGRRRAHADLRTAYTPRAAGGGRRAGARRRAAFARPHPHSHHRPAKRRRPRSPGAQHRNQQQRFCMPWRKSLCATETSVRKHRNGSSTWRRCG